MTALLDHAEQAISITEVARSTKDIVDRLERGDQDHYVVMRNNAPAAVMLAVRDFEAIMNELENLRIEAVARDRLAAFDPQRVISDDEIWRKVLANDEDEVEGIVSSGGSR